VSRFRVRNQDFNLPNIYSAMHYITQLVLYHVSTPKEKNVGENFYINVKNMFFMPHVASWGKAIGFIPRPLMKMMSVKTYIQRVWYIPYQAETYPC
jgi:hypothetical protein